MIAHVYQSNLDRVSGHTVEDQAGRVFLAADSQREDIDLGLGCCEGYRNFEHMGSKLKFFSLRQIISVILDKSGAALTVLGHLHQNCGECCDLVISLRSEADASSHQVLSRNTRKLLQSIQILEGICKCTDLILLKELVESDFILCLLADSLDVGSLHRVFGSILFHLCINFCICHFIDDLHQIADRIVVGLPAVLDLSLNTVAIRNRYLAHVISKGRNFQLL